MTISAVVLTKNEEKNIGDCLKMLSWCDERIVIDDGSTDKTKEIAKEHKAKIYERALNNDFAVQRNFGLEKANGEWVFFVDADERVPDVLKNEILKQVQNDKMNGYFIKRQDTMWGKILRHGEQGNVQLLRLAKKDEGGKWTGKVHETWKMIHPVGVLQNHLQHFPHPTLAEFLREINYYSSLRADELHEMKIKTNWLMVLAYPKAKFLQNYFVKLGFLDGMQGFLVAILMSFHSFLVRGKLWQLNNE